MNKKLGLLFLILMIAMLSALPASASPLSDDQQEALQIAALINEYRAQNGLYQYIYNPVLEAAAKAHTEYQASIGESTHYGEGHSRSRDRAEAAGYGNGAYIFVSEMIYAGQYATPQAALAWWKNSPIHNGIMLSTDYDEFGVGVVHTADKIYYTVDLGRIQGVTSPGVGSGGEVALEATSAPVTVVPPDDTGAIFHTVEDGQTLAGIAAAYNVPIETLTLLNGLTENSALTAGQLLVIQLPQATPENMIVETNQAGAEATSTVEQPTATEAQATEPSPTDTPVPTLTSAAPAAEPDGDEGITNLLLIILIVLIILAGGGFGFYYFYWKDQAKDHDGDERTGGEPAGDKHAGHDTADFAHQSRQTQFQMLREVAEVALDAYPLDVIKIEPLRYVLNAEFLVDARPESGGEREQFVVRVNAPGFHTRAEIASELNWLYALNEQTKINVPNPVRKRNGEWVETVEQPFLQQPRHCVVFRYIPGSTIEMEATPEHLEVVGALIGLLHNHGAKFNPPQGFIRKHWDLEGLTGGMLDVPAEQAYAALSEHEHEIVNEAEKLVSEAMDRIGKSPQTYGLIHADLHLKSFLFHEGKPLILDFDTCGYGYYAYDLAVPIWNLFHRDDFAPLKAALLKGYRRVRTLSDLEESMLTHFVAGRLMGQILAWAGRREHTNLSEIADEAIKKQVGQLELLIRMLKV